MPTLRESSKSSWFSNDTLEQINAGSLQRIADAIEMSCKDREKLERDYAYMRQSRDSANAAVDRLTRSNAALRGVINRMRKARSAKP